MSAEMIRTFIEYHIDMTRRVWDSINQITEEQFVADDSYSRGSIRNLMVHITRTDQRWLMGLKNLSIPNGDFKFENYPTRSAARDYCDKIAAEMTGYVATLNDADMGAKPDQPARPALDYPPASGEPRHGSSRDGSATTPRARRADLRPGFHYVAVEQK